MTTEAQKIQDIGSWSKVGDFFIELHGSICLVRPQNDVASDWLAEESRSAYEAGSEWQFFGNALAVEPRYLDNVLGLLNAEGWRYS